MAIDSNTGDTLMAVQMYGQEGSDFLPGPLPPNASIGFTPPDVHLAQFTRFQVEDGKLDSNKLANGVLKWPASYTYQGNQFPLAPFQDNNKNGIYEPKLGEIPSYNGEDYIYFVYHDMVNHPVSKTAPIGLQIQTEAFGFSRLYSSIDAVLFLKYKVISTSRNLKEFRMGVYTDFDLGNYSDDMIGTDTSRNMVYVYNGDQDDEGILGYGLNPPAMGIVFLNQPLCQSCFHMNQPRWKDSTHAFRPPFHPKEFKNLLEAKNTAGDSMTVLTPGSMYGKKSRYAFTGDPSTSTGWTMDSDTFSGNDYRSLAITGAPSLNKSDTFELFLMYVYDRTTPNGGRLASIDSIRAKVDFLRARGFIQQKPQIPADCFAPRITKDTTGQGTGIFPSYQMETSTVYPNPADKSLTVQLSHENSNFTCKIMNELGQVILKDSGTGELKIDCSNLPQGIYYVHLEATQLGQRSVHKLVVLH